MASEILREVRHAASDVLKNGTIFGSQQVLTTGAMAHVEETHQAVQFDRIMRLYFESVYKMLGQDTRVWASVHLTHHRFPDMNPYVFLKYLEAYDYQQVHHPSMHVEKEVPFMDPYVQAFSQYDTLEIGEMALDEGIRRLNQSGLEYLPPEYIPDEELHARLNPQAPMYPYTREKHKKGTPYTQDEKLWRFLVDAHSPSLAPDVTDIWGRPHHNGVRFVVIHDVSLYKNSADMYKQEPGLMEEWLRPPNNQLKNPKPYIAAGLALHAGKALVDRGRYQPQDFVVAGMKGAAAYGIMAAEAAFAGNIVNPLGHMGDAQSDMDIINAVIRRDYTIRPHPKGSVSTNTAHLGPTGLILSLATLDNVGWQDRHHDEPGDAQFSGSQMPSVTVDGLFGWGLKRAANNPYIPGVGPGKQFGLPPGTNRPDDPHELVDIVWAARRAQMALAG